MTRFFVRHPVATWMIFGAFVLLGAYALPRLQIEAIPETDLPTLTVQTVWNGASPLAIQRAITVPVEEAARKVHGVEDIKSVSRAAWSQVEISFRRGVDIEFARVDLNEQLGVVRRNLPLNAGQPQIVPYVPEEFRAEQYFTFSLESPLSPNELNDLAEQWVLPQLLAVEGVADARVQGGARPLTKIFLDRRKLELYGITPDEVFVALDRLDDVEGAGTVYDAGTEKYVARRDPVRFARLRDAVVAQRGGRTFTLSMLGEARRDFEDPVYFVRSNGRNVVQVLVEKRSGANSIAVSRALRDALPRIEHQVPFDVKFRIDEDQGKDLESKLRELSYRSLVILSLLFLLLVVSLRQVRLTAIVTGSIIFAIVISLTFFYFLRISVNFITISGLTVCFGMALDNGILVLDAIHRRLGALSKAEASRLSRRAKMRIATETIISGAHEVIFPILGSTLTTVVVFLSFIFLSGRLALFYVPLGISVATAMIASIFVALGWVPMVLDGGWARSVIRRSPDGPHELEKEEDVAHYTEATVDYDSRPPMVERIVVRSQKLWWIIIPVTVGVLVWGAHIYDNKVIKGGFWRLPNIEELVAYVEMPSGTDVRLTSETMLLFENALLPVKDGVQMRSTTWGNQAYLRVEFEKDVLRTEIPMLYRQLLMEEADKLGGTSVFISGFSETPYVKGSFGGSTLNSMIKITGYNSRKLQDIADRALVEIQRNRRVRNARITTGSQFERIFQDEVVIGVDRAELARHGLSVLQVVGHLRRLLGVDTPATLLMDDDQERIQLAYYDSESIQLADAEQTMLRAPTGETVRLGDVVRASTRPLSGSITRENQRYTTHLNWEYVGTDQMRLAFIKRVLDSLDLPYGFAAEESQREFYTEEEEEQLTLAVALSVILIFMVLAALFESLTLPFFVLLSIPMALVGVYAAFWLTRSSFDSSARIGLILLFGVVVNNAILLAGEFRREASRILKTVLGGDPSERLALFPDTTAQPGGVDLYELPRAQRAPLLQRAVARATRIRLRSILLTTGTTIVGLAPLLVHFRQTEDKDIWENLALASIGGLTSSTLLILFAMPAIYYVITRFAGWPWRDAWRRSRRLTRTAMVTGAVYAGVLVAALGTVLYFAHLTYRATDPGTAVVLRESHRDIVRAAGIAFTVSLGVWAAMVAGAGSWWKGLVAYAAGIAMSALAFSAVNLLDLAFLKKPLGFLWIQSDAILIGAVGPGLIFGAWLLRRRRSARTKSAPGFA
jgi:hydrophobic/amphiphilic exporter-1 (mainly G- bacteria), HAE1 family